MSEGKGTESGQEKCFRERSQNLTEERCDQIPTSDKSKRMSTMPGEAVRTEVSTPTTEKAQNKT